MNISEARLRELVMRALRELYGEAEEPTRQKIYMVCGDRWDDRYEETLKNLDSTRYLVCPVIPADWQNTVKVKNLQAVPACGVPLVRSDDMPADLEETVSLFPVVSRDVLVKTALCLSDTFENRWITSCIARGSRTMLLRSGLERFTGRETPAYVSRIMEYCRQVLTYGIELGSLEELDRDRKAPAPVSVCSVEQAAPTERKKQVITSSNVEKLAVNGVIHLQKGDIVTDLARDRAKFLHIVFR